MFKLFVFLVSIPFSPLSPTFHGLLTKLFSAQYNCLLPPDTTTLLLSNILYSTLFFQPFSVGLRIALKLSLAPTQKLKKV